MGRSDLNLFLFAEIGVEPSGMPLSVVSALARLGVDPWLEARRLAGLSRRAAADWLAEMIASMPASRWPQQEAMAVASRLVALLPAPQRSAATVAGPVMPNWAWLLAGVLAAALMSASVLRFGPIPPLPEPAAAPQTVPAAGPPAPHTTPPQ
jgi:hypothetical protein